MGIKKGTKLVKNPKMARLGLRLAEEEAERIQRCANFLGTTRTGAILHGIELVEKEIKRNKKGNS